MHKTGWIWKRLVFVHMRFALTLTILLTLLSVHRGCQSHPHIAHKRWLSSIPIHTLLARFARQSVWVMVVWRYSYGVKALELKSNLDDFLSRSTLGKYWEEESAHVWEEMQQWLKIHGYFEAAFDLVPYLKNFFFKNQLTFCSLEHRGIFMYTYLQFVFIFVACFFVQTFTWAFFSFSFF